MRYADRDEREDKASVKPKRATQAKKRKRPMNGQVRHKPERQEEGYKRPGDNREGGEGGHFNGTGYHLAHLYTDRRKRNGDGRRSS